MGVHMLTSFYKESERQERKVIIKKMNEELNKTLDRIFEEAYPEIHQQFLEAGFTEEEAQSNIEEIKSEMQREMIVHAQQSLKQKLEKISTRNVPSPSSSDRK